MFLTRSMILNRPTSSMRPTSPVWTQPSSSIVSFVASGSADAKQVYQGSRRGGRDERGGGLTLVVFREAVGTPHTDLSTWVGFIQHSVPHTWNIDQLDLVHWLRPSNGSRRSRVPGERLHACSTILGHTIPLKEIAYQGHPEEVHDLRVERCASTDKQFDPPSEDRPDLVEYKSIPEWMGVITGLLQPLQFCGYAASEQGALETRGLEVGHNRLVNSVEDSRDRYEGIRFEDLHVFGETQGRTGGITDRTTSSGDVKLTRSLHEEEESQCFGSFMERGLNLPQRCGREADTRA